ncbi:helix-turn-helix domain-containing protein [Rhizobium sp. 1AS11]|uniref:helix-turn-helix domain-containing protein n=1 Tax=Rhizobium acaciae TaxID=2989736 RepID=UPI00222216D1|nr:helix-turn-helix transcriptional regulator [Rhizobium acaciae]MCW1413512.1 helix-turn-helix domain-containing protein [Rhizobium acaciae]MCW1745748.1 helix-turn-helix domain-containing protein [Rhizobium acaciae]
MDAKRTGQKQRRTIKAEGAHPVDAHVGQRILLARQAKRMSQKVLADQLGITFQQIQKYEKGKNRVSASVLYGITCALDVPATYFFDGLGTGDGPAPVATPLAVENLKALKPLFTVQENVNLLQNYLRAPLAVRKAVRSLLSIVATEET